MDQSSEAVARIRDELGVRAVVGTLPHPDLEPRSIDVVTMWHSLEHVHQPLDALRAARRLLAPGGRLIMAVPNIDSTAFRWFGPAWFGLDLPRHLAHFTPTTLRLMLDKAGFRMTAIRPVRHSDWLRSSAHLANRLGRRSLRQRLLMNKHVAKLVAGGCHLLRRSDCIWVQAEVATSIGPDQWTDGQMATTASN
jgi:SAM-dependent methyltransferase